MTDDWTASRNCDVENVCEWVGYSFFYVRFISQSTNDDEQGLQEEAAQRPVAPSLPGRDDTVERAMLAPLPFNPGLWSVELWLLEGMMMLAFRRV